MNILLLKIKISINSEQEAQLNDLFKKHFLSNPEKFDEFVERFGDRMYKQYKQYKDR